MEKKSYYKLRIPYRKLTAEEKDQLSHIRKIIKATYYEYYICNHAKELHYNSLVIWLQQTLHDKHWTTLTCVIGERMRTLGHECYVPVSTKVQKQLRLDFIDMVLADKHWLTTWVPKPSRRKEKVPCKT